MADAGRRGGLHQAALRQGPLAALRLAATLLIPILAFAVTAAVATPASASGGGVGAGDPCWGGQFGERPLERGDCGPDVRTLNWILRSQLFAVPLEGDFGDPTEVSVREFQREQGLEADGVVADDEALALRRSLRRDVASWYGPGLYGNRTACGERLRRTTLGVAHRRLPCGTKVVVGYRGRWVRTRVIDRGPYAKRSRYEVDWDLTSRTAERLRLTGREHVRVGVIK